MDRTPHTAGGPQLRLCYPPEDARSTPSQSAPASASTAAPASPIKPAMTIRMGKPIGFAAQPPRQPAVRSTTTSFARPPRAADALPPMTRHAARQTPAPPARSTYRTPLSPFAPTAAPRPSMVPPGPARLRAAESQPIPRPPVINLRHDDPRWVLAVHAHLAMQGAILRPDARRDLLRSAAALGLDAFSANLIIAIVQDRARRGLGPADASQLLLMIPSPGATRTSSPDLIDAAHPPLEPSPANRRLYLQAAIGCIGFLLIELGLILSVL